MNYGKYALEELIESEVNNYMHFISKYNLIEDCTIFEELLIDLNKFEQLIKKIISVYDNYCLELEEVTEAIFICLNHYKNKFQNELEPFHIYSFFNFDNINNYNKILTENKIKNKTIEKYKNNLELFTFIGVLLKNMFGLFIIDKDYKIMNIEKEVLLTKIENF